MRARSAISTTEATRYEITATKGDESFHVGFTRGTSRHSLLVAIQSRGDQLIERCNVTDDDGVSFVRINTRWAARIAGWTIGYTGRTEREAASCSQK